MMRKGHRARRFEDLGRVPTVFFNAGGGASRADRIASR
jgi:hypothetical protein